MTNDVSRQQALKALDAIKDWGLAEGDGSFYHSNIRREIYNGIETIRNFIQQFEVTAPEKIPQKRKAKLSYVIWELSQNLKGRNITGSIWNDALRYLEEYQKQDTEKDRVLKIMAEQLEECKTAIDWYRSEHPEDFSNADGEFDERYNNALAEYAKLEKG